MLLVWNYLNGSFTFPDIIHMGKLFQESISSEAPCTQHMYSLYSGILLRNSPLESMPDNNTPTNNTSRTQYLCNMHLNYYCASIQCAWALKVSFRGNQHMQILQWICCGNICARKIGHVQISSNRNYFVSESNEENRSEQNFPFPAVALRFHQHILSHNLPWLDAD